MSDFVRYSVILSLGIVMIVAGSFADPSGVLALVGFLLVGWGTAGAMLR